MSKVGNIVREREKNEKGERKMKREVEWWEEGEIDGKWFRKMQRKWEWFKERGR